ncbi:ROK family transcriptional regulator [Kutzneria sp. NPDC051319]|uniref:ROK family transcriptional regulator n=1 Tax=Kutzneria sp. NPDC051319 TaxID=3155047 RepID=UPI0034337C12
MDAEERLLDLLGRSVGLTRAQLARELGLSKATVSGLVGDLLARGVVTEAEQSAGGTGSIARPVEAGGAIAVPRKSAGGVGRPGTVVRLTGPDRAFAVLRWSGHHLWSTLADFAGGTLAARSDEVPVDMDQAELVADVEAELTGLHREAGREAGYTLGVVLAVPAPFQPGVGIPAPGPSAWAAKPEESPMWAHAGWLATDPVPALKERLGIHVIAENDANLAALGEATAGAGRGLDSVVYVKVTPNTIGMGIVLGGRIHRGANGFAGELAHVQVNPQGPLCYCGGRGCLRGLLGQALVDAVRPAYQRDITFQDVLALAEAGEPGPRRILDDLGLTLGRALADFCTLLNPAAIIVDGSLGGAGEIVAAAVRESIARHSAPHAAGAVRVMCGELAERAEVLGALAMVRDRRYG